MPHAQMIKSLEETGNFRVLRKLDLDAVHLKKEFPPFRTGIFLDLETSGLNPSQDEVIEIAMIPFQFSKDGYVVQIGTIFSQLNQPNKPVPENISKLTGITNEMLQGRRISTEDVSRIASDAEVIISHNAAFDRKFAEKISPAFIQKSWACSFKQMNWERAGFEGAKLSHLVLQAGYFFDGHRAANDCLAALMLLSKGYDSLQMTGLAHILANYETPTWRIWAENAPFDLKDHLKRRGYRWNTEPPNPRAWYIDLHSEESKNLEIKYLREEIYRRDVDLQIRQITALDRFSVRA